MSTHPNAKAFMFVGVLVLAASSLAVPVDPNAEDGVAAIIYNGGTANALCTNGEVWTFNDYWNRLSHMDPPVPVSDIADWDYSGFIHVNGEYWYWSGTEVWNVMPLPPPCGPVEAEPQSLGSVKEMYRDSNR